MTEERTAGKRVRADAHRNRERLLEVARLAFAADSGKVTLEGIARDAGVGIGTLYRHFPTRDALVEAVYRAELERLCDAAGHLLTGRPADLALRAWMDRFADYVAVKRDIAEALRAVMAAGAVTVSQARERLATAVRTVLDAGVADATLRADADALDVVVSVVGIFAVTDGRAQAGRLLDLLVDGLRTPGRRAALLPPHPG